MVIRFALFVALIILSLQSLMADIRLSSSVEPLSGTTADQYTFIVLVEGTNVGGTPLLSGGEDFELQFLDTRSSTVIRNGDVSQQVELRYELVPKRVGKLSTPSVELTVSGQKFSAAAIPVTVSQAPAPDPNQTSGTFLRQSVSDNSVYVGEQAIVTLSLLSDQRLVDAHFSDLRYEGVWKEELGKERSFRRIIDGKEFNVHQLKHALFPLRSGTLTIPGRRMTVTQLVNTSSNQFGRFGSFDLFDPDFFGFQRKKTVRLESTPLDLMVRPLPAPPSKLAPFRQKNVLVGKTSLALGYDSSPIAVGDGVTVTFELKTEGNANPLSELPLEFPSSLKVYPETPETKKNVVGNKLQFTKRFRYSLVALNPGTVEIPGIKLLYFDPSKEQYELAESRVIRLTVEGNVSTEASEKSQPPIGEQLSPTDDQNTQLNPLAYEELSFLQTLDRQLSLPLALVLISIVATLSFGTYLAIRVLVLRKARFSTLQELEQAENLEELRKVFLQHISARLNLVSSNSDRLQLTSALEKRNIAVTDIHQILSFLDDFDYAQYGKGKEGLQSLRERAKEISQSLG